MELKESLTIQMLDLCTALNKRLYEKDRVNADRVAQWLVACREQLKGDK